MDLSIVQIIWFILIIVLWIGYLTLEGFGFGTGMLLKILPKNAKERRLAVSTIGPHWDGNEVFLLTAGGATFAAFPEWYATMFSGMYTALVAVLLLLIVRICAIEWRGKISSDSWQNAWDTIHTVAAWLVTLVWGVAFGNLVQGMDIQVGTFTAPGGEFIPAPPEGVDAALADGAGHFLVGGFVSLFTPFTILAGLVVVSLFLTHGALWLSVKTTGDFSDRATALAKKLSFVSTGLTAVWGLWATMAYNPNALGWLFLALTAVALIAALVLVQNNRTLASFWASFAGIGLAVVCIFSTFWPNALKSSTDPAYNLTLVQASATTATHQVMLIAAVIFVPIVLVYMVWSYVKFAKRMGVEQVPDQAGGLDLTNVRAFAR